MPTPTMPAADADFNFLAVEPQLLAYLREAMPELVRVDTAAMLDTIELEHLPTPCAALVWRGAKASVTPSGPQEFTQNWSVVLAVRFAGDETGEYTRQEAGPLITKLLRVMREFSVPYGFEPAQLSDDINPDYAPGGLLLVPLHFSTSVVC